jgi:hypothetical protein
VELKPEDGVAHYNLACSLAVLGIVDDALAELWLAFDMGYDDVLHLESDPDLESLRHLPGYVELLQVYGDLANPLECGQDDCPDFDADLYDDDLDLDGFSDDDSSLEEDDDD